MATTPLSIVKLQHEQGGISILFIVLSKSYSLTRKVQYNSNSSNNNYNTAAATATTETTIMVNSNEETIQYIIIRIWQQSTKGKHLSSTGVIDRLSSFYLLSSHKTTSSLVGEIQYKNNSNSSYAVIQKRRQMAMATTIIATTTAAFEGNDHTATIKCPKWTTL